MTKPIAGSGLPRVAMTAPRLCDPRERRRVSVFFCQRIRYSKSSGVRGAGASSGTQNATMLSLVSSGVGICTSSMRPLPQLPRGSTQALGRSS